MKMKKVFLVVAFILSASTAHAFTVEKWTPDNAKNSTLSGIASQYNLTLNDLLSLNPQIVNPNIIFEGQEINTGETMLGSFNPTGGGTYRLKSSIGTTNTSISLSSFKEPVSLIPYTMSYMNTDIAYGTLDPQTSYSEFVSFTGITQSADGSATLTGVTRGLSRSFPYTASTTLRQAHAGQSIFILSNSPQLYDEYAKKRTNEGISGLWSFFTPPIATTTATSSNQLVNKNYVDNVVNAGAATSTLTNGGIVELGTAAEAAAAYDGGLSKPTVLTTSIASSTRVGNNNVVVTTRASDGFIDPTFIATSSNYTWVGNHIFNNTNPINGLPASTTFTTRANFGTSTSFNSIEYKFPDSIQAASTSLITDASGKLYWGIPSMATGVEIRQQGATGNQVITHGLGRKPITIEISVQSGVDQTYGGAGYCGQIRSTGFYTSFSTTTTIQMSMFTGLFENANGTSRVRSLASTSQSSIIYAQGPNGPSAGVEIEATISEVTATTFTINWATNTSGAGACDVSSQRSLIWKVY